MKLHLIRHAKTNQNSASGNDFDRELMPRGKRQCATLYKYLDKKEFSFVQIYCSASARTMQTFAAIEYAFPSKEITYNPAWHLCSRDTWLNAIWKTERKEDLFIIGHNFGLSDLLSYLTGADRVMATSEYVCLSFPFDTWEEISANTGTIVDQYRPADL